MAPIKEGHDALREILKLRRDQLPDRCRAVTEILIAHTSLVTALYERELLLLRQAAAGPPTDQIEGLVQKQVAAVQALRKEIPQH